MSKQLMITPITERYRWLKQCREEYETAFPKEERMPFAQLITPQKGTECCALESSGRFIGFFYTLQQQDSVFLFYFAISKAMRSCGYGAKAIKLILQRYQDKHLLLDIEEIDPDAKNIEQRRQRKSFYLRNGLFPSGWYLRYWGVTYELLSSVESCRKKDIEALKSLLAEPFHPVFFQKADMPERKEQTL